MGPESSRRQHSMLRRQTISPHRLPNRSRGFTDSGDTRSGTVTHETPENGGVRASVLREPKDCRLPAM